MKWALLGTYFPPSQDVSRLYHELSKAMDHLSETFENFLFPGYFNNVENGHEIRSFLYVYGLKNFIKAATYF